MQVSGVVSPRDLLISVENPLTRFDLACNKLHLLTRKDANSTECEAPTSHTSTRLAAGQCVPVVLRLPVCGGGEGMLPRLWKVHQRLRLIRKTRIERTLAWMRELLYTLLPHTYAMRADDALLMVEKCCLSYAGVSLDRYNGGIGGQDQTDLQQTSPLLSYQKRKARQRLLSKF